MYNPCMPYQTQQVKKAYGKKAAMAAAAAKGAGKASIGSMMKNCK